MLTHIKVRGTNCESYSIYSHWFSPTKCIALMIDIRKFTDSDYEFSVNFKAFI